MVEELFISENVSKAEKYEALLPQIKALVESESDTIANLSNVSAALKHTFGFLWVGFYLVKGEQLVLGPFQGPVACTRIGMGKGVCGSAWKEGLTIVVDNVDEFPDHIACSSDSKSEIVVPIFKKKKVIGVLDVDSDKKAHFDEVDHKYLEELMIYLANYL